MLVGSCSNEKLCRDGRRRFYTKLVALRPWRGSSVVYLKAVVNHRCFFLTFLALTPKAVLPRYTRKAERHLLGLVSLGRISP